MELDRITITDAGTTYLVTIEMTSMEIFRLTGLAENHVRETAAAGRSMQNLKEAWALYEALEKIDRRADELFSLTNHKVGTRKDGVSVIAARPKGPAKDEINLE